MEVIKENKDLSKEMLFFIDNFAYHAEHEGKVRAFVLNYVSKTYVTNRLTWTKLGIYSRAPKRLLGYIELSYVYATGKLVVTTFDYNNKFINVDKVYFYCYVRNNETMKYLMRDCFIGAILKLTKR